MLPDGPCHIPHPRAAHPPHKQTTKRTTRISLLCIVIENSPLSPPLCFPQKSTKEEERRPRAFGVGKIDCNRLPFEVI